jgi:hypothetical protein
MFDFLRRAQPHQPNPQLVHALAGDGLPPGMDPATLLVMHSKGSYSGRNVSYFRVFDPRRATDRGLQLRVYDDLDKHPDLILGSGHVERDGAVVLNRRQG